MTQYGTALLCAEANVKITDLLTENWNIINEVTVVHVHHRNECVLVLVNQTPSPPSSWVTTQSMVRQKVRQYDYNRARLDGFRLGVP